MNVAEELSAAQVGKASMAYTEAMSVLSEKPKKFAKWAWLSAFAFSIPYLLIARFTDWIGNGSFTITPFSYFLAIFMAAAGFFLTFQNYQEVRQMRKRLDAAIVLLNLTSQNEIDLSKNKF